MGQIQYTQLTDKECCYGSSNKVYNIPVGSTIHEIATITGVSITRAIELQELLIQDSPDCDVFYSVEIEEQVKKNNCTQGTGSVVTITSVEGQFSSQISQEDADQKAKDFFDANKQRIANVQGTCIDNTVTFTNTAISENIQKNNCTVGEGSVETVTLSSGIFRSTVSQVEADAKGQAYFDSIKQNTANTQGSCIEDGCIDCTSYRINRSVDCGEYRINTRCVDGECLDSSSEYFVCTGSCLGETCVEPCDECGLNCVTGTCPAGFNCINGNCIKDCTGQPCSIECPDNDTDDVCTECIDGLEATIDCPFGTQCVNGDCCVTEGFDVDGNCCSGLFRFEGTCVSSCPEGYIQEDTSCLLPALCANSGTTSLSEQLGNRSFIGKNEVDNILFKAQSTSSSTANQKLTLIVNDIQIYETPCLSNNIFYYPIKLNDVVELDVNVNCNNGAANNNEQFGNVTRSCVTSVLEPQLIKGNTISYTDNFQTSTTVQTRYFYITEPGTITINGDALLSSNQILAVTNDLSTSVSIGFSGVLNSPLVIDVKPFDLFYVTTSAGNPFSTDTNVILGIGSVQVNQLNWTLEFR